MHNLRFRTVLSAALLLLIASTAQASLSRLDFTGTIVANFPDDGAILATPVSGFFILDPTVTDDRPDDPDNARYPGAILDGSMLIDDVSYDFGGGPLDSVFVLNDNAILNDIFSLLVSVQDIDGNGLAVSLQLMDSTRTVFSDDSFPDSIDLADFDPFSVDNVNGTGIFVATLGGGSQQGGFITSAQLSAIPIPAAVWLLAPALLTLARRRHSQSPLSVSACA